MVWSVSADAPDIRELLHQLDATEQDAHSLVAKLPKDAGSRRPSSDRWSVAECFDHLTKANTAYLSEMKPAAAQARARGRYRTGPATPGFIGAWFARSQEPPVKQRLKSPRMIVPQPQMSLAEAFPAFLASHGEVRTFVTTHADLDLAHVRFPNPFVWGVRFSLASALYIIAAHERRHLWQARQIWPS